MEENNLLTETYQNAKKELQTVILQLEEQLNEQNAKQDALRSEIEKLKVEVTEKTVLQTRLKELEEQLVQSEDRLKQEVFPYSRILKTRISRISSANSIQVFHLFS